MNNRRDFIKWVVYLGATAAIAKISSVVELPTDVLEGISTVDKRICEISGNATAFRISKDAAFERAMVDAWKQANGSTKYVRMVQDFGLCSPELKDVPGRRPWGPLNSECYVTYFQYRRAA